MPTKKVRYAQPLLGEANPAGYLIVVPGASVLIRQDGVECDVFADNDGTAMTNPVPTGVPVGTAGVDVRGTLLVYLDPGSGYDGVATVGGEASTFPIPDISPDVTDVGDPAAIVAVADDLDAFTTATATALAGKQDTIPSGTFADATATTESLTDLDADVTALQAGVADLAVNSIIIPAANMESASSSNSPTRAFATGGASMWSMLEAVSLVVATVAYPADWATYNVDLVWTNASAAAGDVAWRWDTNGFNSGDSTNGDLDMGVVTVITAPAQNVAKTSRIASGVAVDNKAFRYIRVTRTGGASGDAGDTLAGSVGVIAAILTKAT